MEKWHSDSKITGTLCPETIGTASPKYPALFRPFYAKLFTGEVEAKLVALRCSQCPEGYNRWSLQLLADQMVSLAYVEHMSRESVRGILKKTNLSPGKSRVG